MENIFKSNDKFWKSLPFPTRFLITVVGSFGGLFSFFPLLTQAWATALKTVIIKTPPSVLEMPAIHPSIQFGLMASYFVVGAASIWCGILYARFIVHILYAAEEYRSRKYGAKPKKEGFLKFWERQYSITWIFAFDNQQIGNGWLIAVLVSGATTFNAVAATVFLVAPIALFVVIWLLCREST